MKVDDTFRDEFMQILKTLADALERMRALERILDAEIHEETVKRAIGTVVAEGIDMGEFGTETFLQATEFTGILFVRDNGDTWTVYYCRKGKKVKRMEKSEDEVREEFRQAAKIGKVYVGKWWIAVEHKVFGAL